MPLENTKLVIQAHHPWRNVLGVTVLLGLLLAMGYLSYQWGWSRAVGELGNTNAENAELLQKTRESMLHSVALQERVAILEQAAQVEKMAYSRVDQALKEFQDDRMELWEELEFYRGVVGNRPKNKGITIHDFKLVPVEGGREYRFKIVLTRVGKNDKVMQGTVEVTIDGVLEGSQTRLALSELSGPPNQELGFRFSHFQRLEGRLILPVGLEPHRLLVVVATSGKLPTQVEKTYEWQALLG
ncbi:MAG: hypothetical protein GY731_02060 [Gammaproteobacteria bacterium]|nr:hypothetical protein [Gammaproteobacteria bacterium]